MTVCSAHRSNGVPCRAPAIRGGRVCVVHGGRAPQVVAKAEQRLRALVYPAISGLAELIAHADSDSVRLSAIKDVLDRTGFRPTDAQPDTAQTVRVTVAFDHANDHADTLEDITFSLPDAT